MGEGDDGEPMRNQTFEIAPSDEALCEQVLAGAHERFAALMQRHNQSLYRAIRSILRDEHQVEEVMQEAWVAAFQHLDSFRGESRFSTWLIRIGVHAALAHKRRSGRVAGEAPDGEAPAPDPEVQVARMQLLGRVEAAVDALPSIYRTVLVLRQVEGLDTAQTAAALGIEPDAVKTRLSRARRMLRALLPEDLLASFPFEAPRCQRIAAAVLARIGAGPAAVAGARA